MLVAWLRNLTKNYMKMWISCRFKCLLRFFIGFSYLLHDFCIFYSVLRTIRVSNVLSFLLQWLRRFFFSVTRACLLSLGIIRSYIFPLLSISVLMLSFMMTTLYLKVDSPKLYVIKLACCMVRKWVRIW